jgi:16S rRNA (cytidine1402-2'-O)-methyltransferase
MRSTTTPVPAPLPDESKIPASSHIPPRPQAHSPEGSRAAGSSKLQAGPAGRLLLVATPIGNAQDITLRALEALREADVIACEDTRVTARLLAIHRIERPLIAYHEHNAARMRPAILERLAKGESVALVSDAGTPLVSDPGYKLVRAAIDAGAAVTALPGPSSVLTALLLSGLPSDRFLFAGFLPSKAGARREALQELARVPATLVLFESANRRAESLADMAEVLGPRPAAMARELTKHFEEVRRDSLPALAAHYREAGPPKGEVVVVIGPPDRAAEAVDDAALDAALADALRQMSVRDAAAAVATATGRSRREVYARALALSRGGGA